MKDTSTEEKNEVIAKLEKQLESRREQIADINQWSSLMISNRGKLRERILWSMIADVLNRTTD